MRDVDILIETLKKPRSLDWVEEHHGRVRSKNLVITAEVMSEILKTPVPRRSDIRKLRLELQSLLKLHQGDMRIRDELLEVLGGPLPESPLVRERLAQVLVHHPNFNVKSTETLPGTPLGSGVTGQVKDYRQEEGKKIADVYTGRGGMARNDWEFITSNLQGCICVFCRGATASLMAHLTPTTNLPYEPLYIGSTMEKLRPFLQSVGRTVLVANFLGPAQDDERVRELRMVASQFGEHSSIVLVPFGETAVYVSPEAPETLWVIGNENVVEGSGTRDLGPTYVGLRIGETRILKRKV